MALLSIHIHDLLTSLVVHILTIRPKRKCCSPAVNITALWERLIPGAVSVGALPRILNGKYLTNQACVNSNSIYEHTRDNEETHLNDKAVTGASTCFLSDKPANTFSDYYLALNPVLLVQDSSFVVSQLVSYVVTIFLWASYQIRKIASCACAWNAGNVFPRGLLQRKPLVSDPGMHHGTCVTHVPWCMSGSLTRGGGENVPGIPGARAPVILRIWQEAHGHGR